MRDSFTVCFTKFVHTFNTVNGSPVVGLEANGLLLLIFLVLFISSVWMGLNIMHRFLMVLQLACLQR